MVSGLYRLTENTWEGVCGDVTLQQWYNSRAYQDLIPIRDKAADVLLISYDA